MVPEVSRFFVFLEDYLMGIDFDPLRAWILRSLLSGELWLVAPINIAFLVPGDS
jgi:hypothetical protein